MIPRSPMPFHDRRKFLARAAGTVALTAAQPFSGLARVAPADSPSLPENAKRKIPIGVFDPAFPDLSLEEMIEKFAGWGVEAVEIGTGGYPGTKHCPVQDMLDDPGKLRAWKKKFEDRN